MYHLMKSTKFTLDHRVLGLMSSYRQTEVGHFQQFCAGQAGDYLRRVGEVRPNRVNGCFYIKLVFNL